MEYEAETERAHAECAAEGGFDPDVGPFFPGRPRA